MVHIGGRILWFDAGGCDAMISVVPAVVSEAVQHYVGAFDRTQARRLV